MPAIRLAAIPDLFNLHARYPARYPVLLETAAGQGWDILLAYPSHIQRYALDQQTHFLDQFTLAWQDGQRETIMDDAHLPFRGGWFVYLGYELHHSLEPSVAARSPVPEDFPVASYMRIPAAVMVDKHTNTAWAFAESADLLGQLQEEAMQCVALALPALNLLNLVEEPDSQFLEGVMRIKRYIAAGDVFQVNLSRRWRAQLQHPHCAPALYQALRRANPAPFAGIADLGAGNIIVSSSPERLAKVDAGQILTRPIAGTHPRHADPVQDALIRSDLIAHPKEQAEHVMLVDLERNDLGRVCVPGSVCVEELMAVASYQHVHHIESTVTGQLRASVTPLEVIRALFPGGTITGCPKVRTMQVIRELELSPRGAYTGSMGYINRDGGMDLNILIRTMTLAGRNLTFSAGAGIVADSEPERELNETRAKAKGLLRALGIYP
ncbi:MAG: aminodeoxychorismate synthase component I [Sulfuriferula sp.]